MGLENTVAQYTLQIVQAGSAAPTIAELKNVQAAAQAAAAGTAASFTATAKGAEEVTQSMTKLAGASYYARSAVDSIRFAAAGGGARAGFYAIDELVRGLMQAGLSAKNLVPILGGIGIVLAGGIVIWREFASDLESAETKAEKLNATLEKLPAIIQSVSDAGQAGLVSPAQSAEWEAILSGQKKMYVNGPGPGDLTDQPGFGPTRSRRVAGTRPLASQEQDQAYVQHQELMAGLNKTQTEAARDLKQIHDQDTADQLTGIWREIAEENLRYQNELQHIKEKQTEATAGGKADNSGALEAAAGKHQVALGNINQEALIAGAKQDAKDIDAAAKSWTDYTQAFEQAYAAEKSAMDTKQAALDRVISKQKELQQIENETTLANLTGEARQQEAIRQTTQAHIQKYTELATALGISQQDQQKEIALIQSGAQVETAALNDRVAHLKTWQQETQTATESFASGFTGAFQKFVDGAKSADQVFTQYAAHFLEEMSSMILQQTILNALGSVGGGGAKGSGLLGAIFGTGGSSDSSLFGAGGVRFAADGILSVSSPTYFPRFNVMAGEAGTEALAVLARPTFRSLGGLDAVVGSAGSSRLALTNADDLAQRGGAGGLIHIRLEHTPETQAVIVQNSVNGAVTEVTRQLSRNGPIAKGVKALTA